MKLNELVCPSCGLRCMVDASFTTCASCNTFFAADQSRSVDNPRPLVPTLDPNITIIWPNVCPPLSPSYPAPSYPWTWVTIGKEISGGTVSSTERDTYQVMN